MFLKIPRLYDSHTHFLATGEFALGLNLGALQSSNVATLVSSIGCVPRRGDWLVGFGWNDGSWERPPHKKDLDKVFADIPVFFIKNDGHSSWVNSKALELLNLESESGVLQETVHLQAFDQLPPFSQRQQKDQLLAACRKFNKAGFTHIRDMSCTESLWNLLTEMSDKNELTLAVEENFTIYHLDELDRALGICRQAKTHETKLLRSKGLKVFFDGSLGSETAYLSQPYCGLENGGRGSVLWELAHLEEVFRRTWDAQLEVSVHTIGDQAAHDVVQLARKISAKGAVGRLNLEHTQVLRPETIQAMKPLHVRCHMQPCHWLSDRAWLKEKLSGLYQFAFPWESLRAAQIPLSFGCDSPIEPPSFVANVKALKLSAKEKIRKFTGDISCHHSHPDSTFADSTTIFEGDELKEVIFNGRQIEL